MRRYGRRTWQHSQAVVGHDNLLPRAISVGHSDFYVLPFIGHNLKGRPGGVLGVTTVCRCGFDFLHLLHGQVERFEWDSLYALAHSLASLRGLSFSSFCSFGCLRSLDALDSCRARVPIFRMGFRLGSFHTASIFLTTSILVDIPLGFCVSSVRRPITCSFRANITGLQPNLLGVESPLE